MNHPARPGSGWVEVVTGSMFSGKSEELIRRVRRAQIARQRVQLFKPRVDDRYAEDEIVSHSDMKMPSQTVSTAREILDLLDDRTEVVAVDEAQFFDTSLVGVVDGLANRGLRVIVAGLDQDYTGRPFDPMPQLLAVAEYVDKMLAICMRCGAPANRSQRLVESRDVVVVGGSKQYEARCRRCFQVGDVRSEG
ncbi:MAG: thymidine kinase [Vicinamibacteria bacterium]